MKNKGVKSRKGAIAISQILILIIGIFAVSYAVGSQVGEVSGKDGVSLAPIPHAGGNLKGVTYTIKEGDWLSAIADRFGIPLEKLISSNPGLETDPNLISIGQEIKIPTTPAEGPGFFKRLFSKLSKPLSGAEMVGATVSYMAIRFVLTFWKTGDAGKALRDAGRIGIGAGTAALSISGLTALGVISGPAGWITMAGMAVGAWLANTFLINKDSRYISLQCKPWKAQIGGDNCAECNDQEFPCTEYQCKTLGESCELINKDTDDKRCIWLNERDVTPPEITPWEDALLDDYSYEPLPAIRGVEIKYDGEDCLPAFTPFTFGIQLDKEGYCKIEYYTTSNFEDMRFDFGGRVTKHKEHIEHGNFPGVANFEAEGIELSNGGNFEIYVRCESANGKSNVEEFLFKFCISDEPDTTNPNIMGFNHRDQVPIRWFDETKPHEVNIEVYVNEPAQCKWGHQDRNYQDMENELSCPTSIINFNAQQTYTCFGNLTGLQNNQENKFYFRCNDNFGNVNRQSKVLTLIGTQPLVITSAEPNGTTVKGSSDSIKVDLIVKTSAGYKSGEATCSYNNKDSTDRTYIIFDKTNSYQHETPIYLDAGSYTYNIQCVDLGGNVEIETIIFDVEKDTIEPMVVRAYKESNSLKIITDEEASCVYDVVDCTYVFEDGLAMQSYDDVSHTTDWNSDKTFYIKCQDEYANQPDPDKCSMIARPFEI